MNTKHSRQARTRCQLKSHPLPNWGLVVFVVSVMSCSSALHTRQVIARMPHSSLSLTLTDDTNRTHLLLLSHLASTPCVAHWFLSFGKLNQLYRQAEQFGSYLSFSFVIEPRYGCGEPSCFGVSCTYGIDHNIQTTSRADTKGNRHQIYHSKEPTKDE